MSHVVSKNDFGQVSAGSNAAVLNALGPILAILNKLMEQKGKLASISASTSWAGAQGSALSTIKAGSAAANETITNAAIEGVGAAASFGCLWAGNQKNEEPRNLAEKEQQSIKRLTTIENLKPENTLHVTDRPPSQLQDVRFDNMKKSLIKTPSSATENENPQEICKAIHSMTPKEYSKFRGNLGRDLAAHRQELAAHLSTQQANQQTSNTYSQILMGISKTVGGGISAKCKIEQAKAQADQTIDSSLQGIAKDQYGSAASGQSEMRNAALGLIDQCYSAARAYYPQQG